jgi:riboflavin synthase
MLGKYVRRILKGSFSKNDALSRGQKDISMELLARNGFLT